MGLDMYAFARKDRPETPVHFETEDDGSEEIFYWRKHPNLHGWMEDLWREKGGIGEFNLEPVLLTAEDIDRLEKAVENDELPQTTGFFFGQSSPEDKELDQEFIRIARGNLAAGMVIYYNSWW